LRADATRVPGLDAFRVRAVPCEAACVVSMDVAVAEGIQRLLDWRSAKHDQKRY